ncbi:MAG TPA: TIGR02594 family protein [Anaerolineae bacterium]|nr:TIGR02594 family protein [Anaerolineae bacterium]
MQRILDIAKSYIGVKEVVGKEHNPTILAWLRKFGKNLSRWATGRDETPWCAVFVSKVLDEAGYRGTDHALARSYISWGKPAKFTPGAVVVIQRHEAGEDESTGSRTGYHVGFFVKVTKHHIVLLGGNQSNQVRVSYFPRRRYRICSIRQPVEL